MQHPDFKPSEVDALVRAFFEAIAGHLEKNGRVELRGFGAFTTRAREERAGRNPRDGSAVKVEAKRVAYFRPSKEMQTLLSLAPTAQPDG